MDAILKGVLAIGLGLVFGAAGFRKLFTTWEWGRQQYLKYYPPWVYYASGVIELVGGVGLFLPRLRFGSAIGIIVMIAIVSAHPWRGADARRVALPALFFSLLSYLAWLTRPGSS